MALDCLLCALQGDVKKLTDDISAVKPTLFVAVPRVLERIQSGIQAKLKAKPWIVRTIVSLAYRWKLSKLKAGVPLNRVSLAITLGGQQNSSQQRFLAEMQPGAHARAPDQSAAVSSSAYMHDSKSCHSFALLDWTWIVRRIIQVRSRRHRCTHAVHT
jgi:hypothetical protein